MPQELNIDPFFTPARRARGAGRALRRAEARAPHRRDPRADRARATRPTPMPAPSRAACGGGCCSPRRWCTSRTSWCSTSRRPASTSSCARCSGTTCAGSTTQGMTIILTTHYLEEAEEMCDEIAIINHGEVVVRDTTDGAARPARRQDAGDPARRRRPTTTPPCPRASSSSAAPTARSPSPTAARRPRPTRSSTRSRDAGIRIRDVATEEPHLEDVFLQPHPRRPHPRRLTPPGPRRRGASSPPPPGAPSGALALAEEQRLDFFVRHGTDPGRVGAHGFGDPQEEFPWQAQMRELRDRERTRRPLLWQAPIRRWRSRVWQRSTVRQLNSQGALSFWRCPCATSDTALMKSR